MIQVAYLADHPAVVPLLARWFRTQWPDYFAGRPADVEGDFYAEANRRGVPVRLVAFVDEELVGTVVLRERALESLPDASPGLGGLYVAEPHRRRGVGTELIRAGMKVAREQGFERLYAGASAAGGLFEALGWELVKVVTEGQERVGLYCCILARGG